jgi:DNA polymerase-3 subunit beta
MFRIPKFIRSIVGCTDTESSRYALGGVNVEVADGVANLTATDGRILVNVSYGAESSQPVNSIVSGKALAKAFASVVKAKCDERMEMSLVNATPVAMVYGKKSPVPMVAEVVEGRFPRWRDVFPVMEPTFAIRLDCDLLATLCKVFVEAGAERATFHFTDEHSAVRIDAVAPTGEVIRAVAMPVATENGGSMPAPLDGFQVNASVAKVG